jgi:hypothetical protein
MTFILTLFFGHLCFLFQMTEVLYPKEEIKVLRSSSGIDVTYLTDAALHRQIYQNATSRTLAAD